MFILTEKNQAAAVQQALRQRLEGTGVTVAHPGGEVLVLEGETFRLDGESLRLLPGVRAVQRLTEPYPLAARMGHPEDTVVSVGKARIGRDFCLIAGPAPTMCTIFLFLSGIYFRLFSVQFRHILGQYPF